MKLEGYKQDSKDYSQTASELVRQFAFAGIAIIWLFKFDKPEPHLIPKELIFPLLCFIITLACDLLQNLIPSIIWSLFYRYHEKKKTDPSLDIKANVGLTYPGWIFYFAKIIVLIVAYIGVIRFLIHKI